MLVLTLALFYLQLKYSLSETVPPISCDSNDEDPEAEDFFWRDYTPCIIPKDALPGGLNSRGNITYIGQVLHHNQLIPAKIDPEEKKVTYEWGYVEYDATAYIKILCTKNANQFEWVNTANRHINKIKNKHFVVGGYEPNNPNITLLIGRKLIDGELALGKVVFTFGQSTLNTSKGGIGYQHGEFAVLAYRSIKDVEDLSTGTCKKTVIINYYAN